MKARTTALSDLERWKKAVSVCEKGLWLGEGSAPDEWLQKMLEEILDRHESLDGKFKLKSIAHDVRAQ